VLVLRGLVSEDHVARALHAINAFLGQGGYAWDEASHSFQMGGAIQTDPALLALMNESGALQAAGALLGQLKTPRGVRQGQVPCPRLSTHAGALDLHTCLRTDVATRTPCFFISDAVWVVVVGTRTPTHTATCSCPITQVRSLHPKYGRWRCASRTCPRRLHPTSGTSTA